MIASAPFAKEILPMTMKEMKPPYRLQVFVPDSIREALRDIAYEERTSLQNLVVHILLERIRTYPRYASLGEEEDAQTVRPLRTAR